MMAAEQANPVASLRTRVLRTVVTRGKGSVESLTLLEGRAIPMGNHEPRWSTCIAKAWLAAEFREQMPGTRPVDKKVAKCLVK